MSYQLNQELNKKSEVEMPTTTVEQTEQPKYDLHPELQNALPKDTEAVEEPLEQEPIKEETKEEKELKYQARNFKEIREQRDLAQRERDELLARLKSYEANKQPQQEEPEYNVEANDLVEGKHLNQYNKKLQKLQEELRYQQQQNQLTATEVRLKNEFPDFDKVVSKDNIEQLRMNYPELAETLNASNSDIYAKAKSAYTLIKKLNIVPEDTYEKDREKTLKNASKPKPLASISPQQSDSPLSRANAFANGLTDELKEQLRKEMYASIKNG